MVKLVDTQDLKSCDLTVVPVRFRLRAPSFILIYQLVKVITRNILFFVFHMHFPCRLNVGISEIDAFRD